MVFPTFTASDLSGLLHFDPSGRGFSGLHANLAAAPAMPVSAGGRLAFTGEAARPYAFNADFTVGNFDPAPLFHALNPERLPPVEGKFSIAGRLSGDGDLAGIAGRMRGDFHLTSKGGVLRVLSTPVSPRDNAGGRMAAIGSFLGAMAATVTGRKDAAQTIADLARRISTIPWRPG